MSRVAPSDGSLKRYFRNAFQRLYRMSKKKVPVSHITSFWNTQLSAGQIVFFSVIAIIEQDDRFLFNTKIHWTFKVYVGIKSFKVLQNAELWDDGTFFGIPDITCRTKNHTKDFLGIKWKWNLHPAIPPPNPKRQKGLYQEQFAPRTVCTKKKLHQEKFVPRKVCAEDSLRQKGLYQEQFSPRTVCTKKSLHQEKFVPRTVCAKKVCTKNSFHQEKFAPKKICTKKCLYQK